MVAEVLWRRKLEQVGIEGRHLRLDVVEEISLNQVAAIDSDWDLLEELINRHVLRSDALLD